MNIRILAVAIGAAVLQGLSACSGQNADAAAKKEDPAIPVEVAPVASGPIEAAYRGTATLEAEDEAVVMAKQTGVIEQILVEEGDRVRAGQVLARLETDKLRLQATRAKAEMERLEQGFKRNESVFQRNLVSREAYERSKFDLDAARADYDLAALALRESELKSPFEGVVTSRFVKLGNLVQVNSQLFRVTKLDRLRAAIYVPERDIYKLRPAHGVKLTVDAWPGRQFIGHVARINPVVDATTGTIKVTVDMDRGQTELKPGMFARAEILYDRRAAALLVPKDAVLVEDAAESVYVVADGKARRRPVKTGYSDAEHYEVVEGLKAGESVVTTGQASLKDDARVEVVKPFGAAPATLATSAAGAG